MAERVPWSEYLQKSLHYNSINNSKEPGKINIKIQEKFIFF